MRRAPGDGIIMLVAGSWAHQHPEQVEAVIPIALAIIGSIGAFLPDGHQDKNIEKEETRDGDDTRGGASVGESSSASGSDIANRTGSRLESHPKTDERVEQKEKDEVRSNGNTWRVEPKGNDFDIVPGNGENGWGDK